MVVQANALVAVANFVSQVTFSRTVEKNNFS